ncbi:hypothetical protein HNO88_003172 [Novosphingobium chloroacetimidivorans]|uniref:DUF1285 domain-containing protein n=1 Tax=Novosphingobium chloroacetimidivorans TaxID=1428314 RepID=A0A7W7KBM9_9SPHN|nr:DUF1285 domain-containing protein [Novosphingobium chloroacetimidivorans]MBB4859840.1 hypothetical protein [Novosphingobium chloroacetimidivorans]
MPYEPPPELASLSLAQIADLVAARKLPPLDKWSPAESGDSEMRIAADGRWYHQGGIIGRPAMVRAFASLLLRDEQGQHWLVTPTQRLSIAVEDAAFVAIDVRQDGDALAFRLNTDDLVIAGPDHPLRVAGDADNPAVYLSVRHGTEARLNRSTWAQLAEIALSGDGASVSSQGVTFPLVAE